ncbi:MAG: DUF4276 family protein [Candidatus Cloacimonetes bacterium]|jgi:hypothetical protein|nr:DUF4276 family protein [Candidatus Cloacimonadota bacterium]MDY0172451.1 DUF4276 family protein [Candidatus Cloacimonadaceae bacterium]
MIYLNVLVEGYAEKGFIESIVADHLGRFCVSAVAACFQTKFDSDLGKKYKGGVVSYSQVRRDLSTWMKQDRRDDCRFTTMIDVYGIGDDFPGFREAMKQRDPYEKVRTLETALCEEIQDRRFIPYFQLHEFEALIFADPAKLEMEYLEYGKEITSLVTLSADTPPERINDNPSTSPSHRIKKLIPPYDKYYAGSRITELIGLETIRQRCPHFNEWLTKLEGLNS